MTVNEVNRNEPLPANTLAGSGMTPPCCAFAGSAHEARAAIKIAALAGCIILEPCRTLDTLPECLGAGADTAELTA